MGEVQANLVSAAGDRSCFDEGKLVVAFENFEVGLGVFGVLDGYRTGNDAMAAVFTRIGSEAGAAGPFILRRIAADDGEVAFVHAAGFEEFAVGAKCAGAFGEEENAGGFGIEAMDVFEEADIAGARPECAADYR